MQRLRSENRDNFWRPCIKRLAANLACDLTEAEEYINHNLVSNHNDNKSWCFFHTFMHLSFTSNYHIFEFSVIRQLK